MRSFLQFMLVLGIATACVRPGSLSKLEKKGIDVQESDVAINLEPNTGQIVEVTYLGCGGVLINKDGDGILIDPFFSNQSTGKIGKSVLLGPDGKSKIRTDQDMLAEGLNAIHRNDDSLVIHAIVNSHSHYDHLMDIPAVYQHFNRQPKLLLTTSGYNIIHQTVDSADVILLEKFQTTHDRHSDPITLKKKKGVIRIYPILSAHNPHFRNIKFFAGEQRFPVMDLKSPFDKTKANLWLEGNTFSFLIEYADEKGDIELSCFIQSSSGHGPLGIPPEELCSRPVDVALIGIASYQFSPEYPCELLSALSPRQLVWVHWEDFYRKYTKKPKTVRGTDVPGFFDIPCVAGYKKSAKLLSPRVKMQLVY